MRIKDVLVVYLQQRIIVFPLHFYFNTLMTRVLDRLSEWNLLSNKKQKFTGKEKYFKFFVEKEINDILLEIKIVYNNLNLKTVNELKEILKSMNISCKGNKKELIEKILSKK